jgi:hypothetical protein
MCQSLLIRDRELVSNGNFLGHVDVFTGNLEAEGCLYDYGIRRWTSIMWYLFFVLCSSFFVSLYSSCVNNIFVVQKKKIRDQYKTY